MYGLLSKKCVGWRVRVLLWYIVSSTLALITTPLALYFIAGKFIRTWCASMYYNIEYLTVLFYPKYIRPFIQRLFRLHSFVFHVCFVFSYFVFIFVFVCFVFWAQYVRYMFYWMICCLMYMSCVFVKVVYLAEYL